MTSSSEHLRLPQNGKKQMVKLEEVGDGQFEFLGSMVSVIDGKWKEDEEEEDDDNQIRSRSPSLRSSEGEDDTTLEDSPIPAILKKADDKVPVNDESAFSTMLSSPAAEQTASDEMGNESNEDMKSDIAIQRTAEEAEQAAKPTKRKHKPKVPKRLRDPEELLDITTFKAANYNTEAYKSWINKDARQDLAILHHVFQESRRLIVVTGAGISVAAGIPDFRSQEGLFASLKQELNLKSSGKAMFDASVYQDNTSLANFHTTVRDLHKLCTSCSPTPFHEYLNKIASQNRLGRLYTQNIDCLDASLNHLTSQVPLKHPWPKTIQLHGTIGTMVCVRCGWLGPLNPDIFTDDGAPECPECIELDSIRAIAGKRSQGIGKLRPRIVLYNEVNPDAEAIGAVTEDDLSCKPDGLIVVGTSLKIPGVRRIVKEMAQAVHHAKGAVVWLNVDEHPQLNNQFEGCFDLFVKGDCQVIPQLIEDFEQEKLEMERQKEREKLERKAKSEERAFKRELKAQQKLKEQSKLNFKSVKRANTKDSIGAKKQKTVSTTAEGITSNTAAAANAISFPSPPSSEAF